MRVRLRVYVAREQLGLFWTAELSKRSLSIYRACVMAGGRRLNVALLILVQRWAASAVTPTKHSRGAGTCGSKCPGREHPGGAGRTWFPNLSCPSHVCGSVSCTANTNVGGSRQENAGNIRPVNALSHTFRGGILRRLRIDSVLYCVPSVYS